MTHCPLLVFTALLAAASGVARSATAQQREAPARSADERLGTVHLQTSCHSSVAARFDRAVALLHSFEFGAAARGFDDVLAADSTCAMAHWGIALSRWGNPMAPGARPAAQLQAGRAAVLAAVSAARSPGTTARERGYIEAVSLLFADTERVDQQARMAAYERAMAQVARANPSDSEARIFHALALAASALPTDKSYANQLEAGRVLEAIWATQPDHPGLAHYIIHAYDHPPLAAKARQAAQRYATIAPSAAHALHMPSHTFTRVGLWTESVEANLRSADIAMRSGSIAEALHASDYAVYAYLQMRRDAQAREILDGLPALAARFDPTVQSGAAPGSAGVFALAAIPARYALERRDWAGAASLVPTPSAFPWAEAMVYFARALGAAHQGDTAAARGSVDSLSAIQQRLAARGEKYWVEQVAIQALAARAWLDRAARRDDAAVTAMRQAADREDATEKSVVTPGPLAPARELLGDMLLELRRPAEALAAYRATLTREPNRFRALDGARRAAAALGDRAAEEQYAAQLRRITS